MTTARSSACAYVIGDDGVARWSQTHSDAWIGLLETHKALTRSLDAELDAEHGLTLSAIEVLGRLAAAPGRRMGLSKLASACALSLSRVSRIADDLQRRGLLTKETSPADARATEATLTDAGLTATCEAQATHFASVQARFFEQLSPAELETLAAVFRRFAPGAASECASDAAHAPAGIPPAT